MKNKRQQILVLIIYCFFVETRQLSKEKTNQDMSCHVMSCYVVMSCHVMSCHVMSCYVMLCYVVLCYVISCHVMSRLASKSTFAFPKIRMNRGKFNIRYFDP